MKRIRLILVGSIAFVIIFSSVCVVILDEVYMLKEKLNTTNNKIEYLDTRTKSIDDKIEDYAKDRTSYVTQKQMQLKIDNVDKLICDLDVLKKRVEQNHNDMVRGLVVESRIMKITAYDLSFESCGKHPDHPAYGITASGEPVKEWFTVAAGKELPFGTKVYLPYFKNKPNKGMFVVKDRGGAIKRNCIDVYMKSYEDCMKFGVKYLEVYILGGE